VVENFEVKTGENKIIRGIINRSYSEHKLPALVFCHGFMGNKLGHNFMFVKMARMLENLNIASVRFDFTGSGESDGEFKDVTLSSEIRDCENVLNFVSSIDYIDKENINILGFSMGAIVAIIVASTHNDIIKNSILVSPAVNMYDIFLSEIKEDKLFEFLNTGYINFENNIVSKNALEDVFNYKIFDYLKGMSGNKLIVHGTKDECVSPLYSQKIKDLLGERAVLKYVPGADHCYSSPTYYEQLSKSVVNFVKQHLV